MYKYFLNAADVFVSSPSYLAEVLELWMKDPCDEEKKSTR